MGFILPPPALFISGEVAAKTLTIKSWMLPWLHRQPPSPFISNLVPNDVDKQAIVIRWALPQRCSAACLPLFLFSDGGSSHFYSGLVNIIHVRLMTEYSRTLFVPYSVLVNIIHVRLVQRSHGHLISFLTQPLTTRIPSLSPRRPR